MRVHVGPCPRPVTVSTTESTHTHTTKKNARQLFSFLCALGRDLSAFFGVLSFFSFLWCFWWPFLVAEKHAEKKKTDRDRDAGNSGANFVVWVGILVLFLVLLVINFCLLAPGGQTPSSGKHDTSLIEVVLAQQAAQTQNAKMFAVWIRKGFWVRSCGV